MLKPLREAGESRLPAAARGGSSRGDYDVRVAHDENIGRMLAKLDELRIADDTIVMYSTDNGPHYNSWPDGGHHPERLARSAGDWRRRGR
jgi:arylsulfatase